MFSYFREALDKSSIIGCLFYKGINLPNYILLPLIIQEPVENAKDSS
ncbi:6356_t:CDS:2 [Dentiscutata erythropus]|uniref:6356_t:CDS:1 n=1 Tax=Dentiscutata erythropus TaxID=1348616 RepID=A0A9N9B5P8_9GLOM|nr:6356_t:CDS:2 [Dentiscutata erythropus]